MFRDFVKNLVCLVADCPQEEQRTKTKTDLRNTMDNVPDRIDRIIEKRIQNNVIESAYLQRLRDEAKPNGR